MSIMTPRGLKIRLDESWAFSLIARVWKADSRTDAFRVLKTCEAIESVPSVLSYISGIAVAFGYPDSPWCIPIAILAGRVAGLCLTRLGLFIVLQPTGVLRLALVWSYIGGYGILLLGGLVAVYIAGGWPAVVMWMVGYPLVVVATSCGELALVMLLRHPLLIAETNFFNAYRLHAQRLGLTLEISVEDGEMASGDWEECLQDYAVKHPEAVAQFNPEMASWGALRQRLGLGLPRTAVSGR